MADTKIEWADAVWNPITGCTPISEGCDHCYAKRMANRLAGRYGYPKDEPFRVTFHPGRMGEPADIKKPRRIFVCSMADIFHKDVEVWMLDQIFAVMAAEYHHTYLILTKRPDLALEYLESECRLDEIYEQWYAVTGKPREAEAWPLPNIWLGVTAENQARADERIPVLLQIPAAVRFVSIEPMLGPVDLSEVPTGMLGAIPPGPSRRLHWVICGGETGPGARPVHPDWVRALRDQCKEAGVPFFFKSFGDWQVASYENGHFDSDMTKNAAHWVDYASGSLHKPSSKGLNNPVAMVRVGKKATGRLLDGREWNEFPEVRS